MSEQTKMEYFTKLYQLTDSIFSFLPYGFYDLYVFLMRRGFRHLPIEKFFDFETKDGLKTVLRGASDDSDFELESPVILSAATAKVSKEPRRGNPRPRILREKVISSIRSGMKTMVCTA